MTSLAVSMASEWRSDAAKKEEAGEQPEPAGDGAEEVEADTQLGPLGRFKVLLEQTGGDEAAAAALAQQSRVVARGRFADKKLSPLAATSGMSAPLKKIPTVDSEGMEMERQASNVTATTTCSSHDDGEQEVARPSSLAKALRAARLSKKDDF